MLQLRTAATASRRARGNSMRSLGKFLLGLLAFLGVGAWRKRHDHDRAPARDPIADANRERGHEFADIRFRGVALTAVLLVAFIALTLLALTGLFALLNNSRQAAIAPSSPLVTTPIVPPEPQLQADPAADWRSLRATEQARLDGYAWIDQGSGVVRVPIDRAMELLEQRGLPTTPPYTETIGPDANSGAEPQTTETPTP